MWLRQSTASQEILLGTFHDSTDGDTEETGLTIANTDIKLWKEGATAQVNKNSGGATHDANGRYYAVLDATDSNTLGKLETNVHVAGALSVRREFMVVPANVYDSLILGTDTLQADVTQWLGTAAATPTTAGVPTTALSAIGLDAITQAATGMVEIAKAVWDRILTGATHNIATSAGRRLRGIQEFQGYESGAIWVDTINGTAGTIDYENGTVEQAALTWADALTLNASLGFNKFIVKGASSITLTANSNNYHIIGSGPTTLALNSQSVIGITVENCVVSGVMTGVGTTQRLIDCSIGAVTLIKGTHVHTSAITGTQTVGEAGDFYYDRSHSGIAGVDTWIFNFGGAIGDTNLNWRNGSGGIQLESMGDTGTDTASVEGRGQIIEGTCTGGTVAVRGLFETSGITNLNLVDGARFQSADLVVDFWSDTLTAYTNGMAGKRLKGLSAATVVEGAVNDVSATTLSFISDLTGYGVNFFRDTEIAVEISADQWQPRVITAYNTTTGEMTVDEAFVSAPADTSKIALTMRHIHSISSINAEMDTAIADAALATEAKQDIIDANVDVLLADDIPGLIGALNDISESNVLTQVNAALDTVIAELGVAAPTATPTLRTGLMLMYMMARNRVDVDTTGTDALKIHNDAGTQIASKTITDDSTDYSESQMS